MGKQVLPPVKINHPEEIDNLTDPHIRCKAEEDFDKAFVIFVETVGRDYAAGYIQRSVNDLAK